jgi:hypothetical protein
LQKKETIYSAGNLLILLGLVVLAAFTFVASLQVTGLLRTGVNLLSSILVSIGAALPFLLKEMDYEQRMRSIGLRCFASSFVVSILLLAQTIFRGFASTVPILASLALALAGIAAYLLSRTRRIAPPSLGEMLLFISVIIVFSAPMIQLSLPRFGVNPDAARILTISLLIFFTAVLYASFKLLKGPGKPAGSS